MRTLTVGLALLCLLFDPALGEATEISSGTRSGNSGPTEILHTSLGVSINDFLKLRLHAGSRSFDTNELGPVDVSVPDQVLFEKVMHENFDLAIYNFVDGKLSHIAVTGMFPKKTIGDAKRELLRLCDSLWGRKRFLGAYESTRLGRTKRYASYRWNLKDRQGKLTFDASAPDMGIGITITMINLEALKRSTAEKGEKRLEKEQELKVFEDVGLKPSR